MLSPDLATLRKEKMIPDKIKTVPNNNKLSMNRRQAVRLGMNPIKYKAWSRAEGVRCLTRASQYR